MVTYPDFVAVNACKVRIGSVFRRIRDDDFNWEVIAVISMKGVAFPRCVFRNGITVFQGNKTLIGFPGIVLAARIGK